MKRVIEVGNVYADHDGYEYVLLEANKKEVILLDVDSGFSCNHFGSARELAPLLTKMSLRKFVKTFLRG